MNPEVITMGRVSVDLYPEQIGVTLADVETFAKSLGGSATNVAVAAARLGHRSALITKAGDDGFGQYVRSALEEFGVDTTWVSTDPELRTPLAFCEIHPPDDFPILFYREPKAPDMNLTVEDLDFDAISAVPLFWITGTGLSAEPYGDPRSPRAQAHGYHGLRPRLQADALGLARGGGPLLQGGVAACHSGRRQSDRGRGSRRHGRSLRGFRSATRPWHRARHRQAGT